jgi:hypothetical protein
MTDASDAAHPGLGPETDVTAETAETAPGAGPDAGGQDEQDLPAPATSDPAQYADDGLGAGDGVVPGDSGLTGTGGADPQPGGAG